MKSAETRPAPDTLLIVTLLALIGLGMIMVGSSSIAIGADDFGEPTFFLVRHLFAIGLGLAGMLVAISIPIAWLNRLASVALLGAIGLLAIVLIPGVGERINGAQRWVELGPIRLQASEPARLLLLVYVASYCVRQNDALRSGFSGFARPVMLIGLCSLLLLKEPDFGATVVLTVTSFGLLFLAGARLRDVALACVAAMLAFAALIVSSPYRLERFLSWLDPWQDQLDGGYQLVNSLYAIGSGLWFGVGLGEGVQKLHYLPEPHTDFVFAVLAEELGLVGATLVIVLFALLVYRAIDLGRRALERDMLFHALLAMGIGIMIGLEATISIGVSTGLLPTKGLALPLISYGKTSAVVTLFALGILFRISRELDAAERRQSGEAA